MIKLGPKLKLISSIQGGLGLATTIFLGLAILSAGATFWGISTQKNDALIINLAGRQRMLVQQMTGLVTEISSSKSGDNIGASFQSNRYDSLQNATQTFEQTLIALQNGGLAPYQPGAMVEIQATPSADSQAALREVRQTWELYKKLMNDLLSQQAPRELYGGRVETFKVTGGVLVDRADAVVRVFESEASFKLGLLKKIQVAFLTIAILLLAMGGWWAKRALFNPLRQLSVEAERIGWGDFDTPIAVTSLKEVDCLVQALQAMQNELTIFREDLRQWGKTLEKKVSQRTGKLEALFEVSREISSHLDIHQVLSTITDKARHLVRSQVAVLCLLEENHAALVRKSFNGAPASIIGETTEIQSHLTAEVLNGKRAMTCDGRCGNGSCKILAAGYRQSHLAAPLWSGDLVIGALCVGSLQQEAFSEEDSLVLTMLAYSAAVAVENARLFTQAERLAALEERQRIAADMHDSLGQTLSYLGLSIDSTCELIQNGRERDARERLSKARQAITQASEDVRAAIAQLMDETIAHRSLQEHLVALAGEINQKECSQVEFVDEVKSPLLLPRDKNEQVKRVAGEALANAMRHACASRILMTLYQSDRSYALDITDNGKGFDQMASPEMSRHFGLKIMQARAAVLGGELCIRSSPGEGTRVGLRWPAQNSLQAVKL